MDSPDDRRSELTCAAMNASWSRPEDVVAWHCDVIACDPPMADAPLRNGEALRGCERAHCCCRPPAPRLAHPAPCCVVPTIPSHHSCFVTNRFTRWRLFAVTWRLSSAAQYPSVRRRNWPWPQVP
jgi:hypothetical protein